MTEKAIAYYRVSTQKQGVSGLGLDAQKQSVTSYAKGRYTIAAEFVEVESGKKNNRAELTKALAMAKELGATLLIAKLDRLSRNVAFTAALNDAANSKDGVKFVAVDMPNVNEMVINMLAVVAQAEAKATSERTKAALKAAKARGTELGTPENLTSEAREAGHETMHQMAKDAYKRDYGYIKLLREGGHTLAQIAERLNEEGNATRNGKQFTPMTVKRILDRGK